MGFLHIENSMTFLAPNERQIKLKISTLDLYLGLIEVV